MTESKICFLSFAFFAAGLGVACPAALAALRGVSSGGGVGGSSVNGEAVYKPIIYE